MSKVHTSFTGREIRERGPLKIDPAHVMAAVDQIKSIGIAMDDAVQMTMAMDSALVGPAGGNLGTPLQFLQAWMPGVVEQITQVRKIDSIVGVQTIGSWEDEEVVQEAGEYTGKAELYGDVTNIPLSGFNSTYERRSILRWEQGAMFGRLEDARAQKHGTNLQARKRAAAARSLDIIRNRVGFYGYNQPDTRVFGLLNDPNLPAYVNVAAGSGGATWAVKTFLEITADIRSAVTALVTQSGGNISPDDTDMVLTIPMGFEEYMGVTSDFGNSVADWLKTTYPRIRVESAPEFLAANGGANVFYLHAERVMDSGDDGGETIVQMVPARFQSLGTETRAKGVVEDYTNALAGVMVKRPYAVVRRSGI